METAVVSPQPPPHQQQRPGCGSMTPGTHGVRRSCDRCGRRKKKCDGERPCRLCIGAGSECTYSKRKWHIRPPQPQGHPQQQQQQPGSGSARAKEFVPHSASDTLLGQRKLSLKRCRLSASPATGLVGMQENAFLSDFFGCVGFLPLTTQSNIRETMVSIMVSSSPLLPPTCEDGCGEEGNDAVARGWGSGIAVGGSQIPMSPSTCIFWCAVALGALVKGSPVESVATYSQLAREALAKSYSGPADVEVAKAWNILAYLYGFMGDLARFNEYLAMSSSFLTHSMEQGSVDALPVGFAEIVGHKEFANASLGAAYSSETGSSCGQELFPPQLNLAANESELYPYVMRSFQVFEKAIYARAFEKSKACAHVGDAESTNDYNPHRSGLLPEDVSDAMAWVWSNTKIVQFEPLEDVVNRPSIGGGIGGLLINGVLVVDKACKGDLSGTLDRIHRCIEVFARYPGLCRSVLGLHMGHMIFAALATIDDTRAIGLYAKLRAAYNISRPPDSLPVPPLEEWQGVTAFCTDLHCRATEGVFAHKRIGVFRTQADIKLEDNKSCTSLDLGGRNQSGPLSTTTSTPRSSANTGCEPEMSSTCEASRGYSRVDAAGEELCMESTQGQRKSVAAAIPPPYHNCDGLEMVFNAEGDRGVVNGGEDVGCSAVCLVAQASSDTAVLMSGEGAIEERGGSGIDAADWLDVTHAMLEKIHAPDEAGL